MGVTKRIWAGREMSVSLRASKELKTPYLPTVSDDDVHLLIMRFRRD